MSSDKTNVGTTTSSINNNNKNLFGRRSLDSNQIGSACRILTKETVPTALVSPQTVRVKVQPPMAPYSARYAATTSVNVNNYGGRHRNLPIDESNLLVEPFRHHSSINMKSSSDSLHDDLNATSSNSVSLSSDVCLNSTISDDRIESIEQRLNFMEALMRSRNVASCSNLSPTKYATLHKCSTPSSMYSLADNRSNSSREVEILNEKVRRMQLELDDERRTHDKQLQRTSNELLRKIDENRMLRCQMSQMEMDNDLLTKRLRDQNVVDANNKTSTLAVDELLREKEHLMETVNKLQCQLDTHRGGSNSDSTSVPIEKYRDLKAKSKKLLSQQSHNLQTIRLERDSAKVQLQLQNAELSELRKTVYDRKNEAKLVESAVDVDELVKLAADCDFRSSCMLAVCDNVLRKQCRPDYDQVLGLKSNEGLSMSEQKKPRPLGADNSLSFYLDSVQNRLSRMQELIENYYTNELVDSIDCRLQ